MQHEEILELLVAELSLGNKANFLPKEHQYIVIGDIHGCIDELKTLLTKQGFTTNATTGLIELNPKNEHKSIVLLGDFIDKANEEKLTQTIEFLHQNFYHLNQYQKHFYLIRGNHEEMVYRYITNDPTLEITPKRLEDKAKYYNSVALLEKNNHLKNLFLELYKESSIWLKYIYNEHFSATFTHAPCPEEFLTKNTQEAASKMVKCISRSKHKGMKLDDLIPYTHQEAKDNQHYHIFGHLSQPNIRHYKNKICIDTSAIYGDTLSCAIIQNEHLTFDSVPFENKQKPATQTYNILFDF